MCSVFFSKSGIPQIEGLRDQAATALFNRFLPNMEQFVVDHTYGGFMCDVKIDTGQLRSAIKVAWYEGRGIWLYSFLYNNFKKDPRYLEIARRSIDFIWKQRPKGSDFWPERFSREGIPDTKPGDIYGNLFIAEGLIEFSKAAGDLHYRAMAKEIILAALAAYDHPDYRYAIRFAPQNLGEVPAPRVLGHWMILLHLATQFLEEANDSEMEQIADRSIHAIMQHHLHPHYGLLNECLHHDFSRPDSGWGEFVCLGHACETLWMVMSEALRRGDNALFQSAGAAFKRHVAVATDPVEGGYFTTLDHVSDYIFQTDKVLWCQEEVLNGALLMAEFADDQWAYDCFLQCHSYIQEKFFHPEYAFVVENGNRNMRHYLKERAEHYHHPRRLMLSLLAFERILQKK